MKTATLHEQQQWYPLDRAAFGQSHPGARARAILDSVVDQLGVTDTAPPPVRYAPVELIRPDGTSFWETYCNIYATDACALMHAVLPHWVTPAGVALPGPVRGAVELTANATVDWLKQHGSSYGWTRVQALEAQELANRGQPVVAVWRNREPSPGHIALVVPGPPGAVPLTAQAGRVCFRRRPVVSGFGKRPVAYWAHE